MTDVKDFIREKGYDFEPRLENKMFSFKSNGVKGWYIGSQEGDRTTFSFGTWATGEKYFYATGYNGQGDEKIQELKVKVKEDKRAINEQTKALAQKIWAGLKQSDHYYLAKKNLNEAFGSRINNWKNQNLLVIPLHDNQGVLWNLQIIGSNKKFLTGGRVLGLYHTIGSYKDKIYIAEGFATAATVYMATNQMTVCAFNCNNLKPVYEAVREAFPSAEIIIAADDDWAKPQNAGTGAAKALEQEFGTKYIIPDFGSKLRGEKDTDWNDLYIRDGLDEIKAQLLKKPNNQEKPQNNAKNETKNDEKEPKSKKTKKKFSITVLDEHSSQKFLGPDLIKYQHGVWPLIKLDSENNLREASEIEACEHLLKFYGKNLVCQDKDVFIYNGKFWKLADPALESRIKMQLAVVYNGKCSNSELESTFKLLLKMARRPGIDLFRQNPYKVNFLNGTLHIENLSLAFRPHNIDDFCTNLIPIEYDETLSNENKAFENLLIKILGEEDIVNKRRAIAQMYGACLAPIFPRLFLLHGLAGTGKSTLIVGAKQLVSEENWCSIEPGEIGEFGLEQGIGKMVNLVTDIDTTKPMRDSFLKKIEDRIPFLVNRKNKAHVKATLPAVHVYGANEIPATLEKGSGSHTRRWTFLELKTFKAVEGEYHKFLINDVFAKNPVGVLNFAVRGLKDLLDCKGHYFNTDEGREKIRSWQTSNDPIGQFFDELEAGEIGSLIVDKDEKSFERKALWPIYVEWYKEAFNAPPKIGKIKFFDRFIMHPSFAALGLYIGQNHAGQRVIRGVGRRPIEIVLGRPQHS